MTNIKNSLFNTGKNLFFERGKRVKFAKKKDSIHDLVDYPCSVRGWSCRMGFDGFPRLYLRKSFQSSVWPWKTRGIPRVGLLQVPSGCGIRNPSRDAVQDGLYGLPQSAVKRFPGKWSLWKGAFVKQSHPRALGTTKKAISVFFNFFFLKGGFLSLTQSVSLFNLHTNIL